MNQTPNFEIPESVRDIAEKSVDQAQEACNRLMETARKAQGVAAKSSEAMTSGAKELQEKVFGYAESNMEQSFKLANELVKAKDLQEALEIQNNFARQQMETYAEQAQELSQLMAKAAKKAQPKA